MTIQNIFEVIREDKYRLLLMAIFVFLAFFSVVALKPSMAGDSLSYIDSMHVIRTGNIPEGFVPNRLLTTYSGLRTIMMFSRVVGSVAVAWMFQNRLLYIIFGLVMYELLKRITEDRKVAFISVLFLTTNYSIVSFGLGYLMDMGGWAFYAISLYLSYRYLDSLQEKWMWLSALSVGIGGTFKEYAFLGYIPLFLSICTVHRYSINSLVKKIVLTGLISFSAVISINIYIILHYHYSYLSWFKHQGELYPNMNYPIEFIKCFGSLFNFGWFFFVHGAYILYKRISKLGVSLLEDSKTTFILFSLISVLPVLVWPPVTRVLFVTVPALVMVSSLSVKKIRSNPWIIVPLFSAYFISSYFMDAYILPFVNLPF